MPDLMSFLSSGGHHIKLKRHEYIRVALALCLIMGLIVLFAFEVKYFSNTFGVRKMVFRSFVVGILVGAALSYWMTKDRPKMETLLKFQIWVALLICCTLVMPFFASFTNRNLSFAKVENIPVDFVRAEGFYADRFGLLDEVEPTGFFLFIIKDNKLERLKTKTNPYPKARENDQILLPVRKGFWGFEYAVD